MKSILIAVLMAALLAPGAFAQGKPLTVVCTLPTMKALTEEVGGNRVEVVALARGDQDPHFVTPTPVLMRKTREAAIFGGNAQQFYRLHQLTPNPAR